VQPCREVLELVETPNDEVLERGEEVKGVLLLLREAFHPADVVPIKFQVGEGGRQGAADRRSKESHGVISREVLQFEQTNCSWRNKLLLLSSFISLQQHLPGTNGIPFSKESWAATDH
jgi:hypothetical protein